MRWAEAGVGHNHAGVAKALKLLALDRETTLQALLNEAISDMLEKHGLPRMAEQAPVPRGGAARWKPSVARASQKLENGVVP